MILNVVDSDDITRKPALVSSLQSLSYICPQVNSNSTTSNEPHSEAPIAYETLTSYLLSMEREIMTVQVEEEEEGRTNLLGRHRKRKREVRLTKSIATDYDSSSDDGDVIPAGTTKRLLCCFHGVVTNDGKDQSEFQVINLSNGRCFGRWRSIKRKRNRKIKSAPRVAAVFPRLTMGRFPASTSLGVMGTTLCCVGGDFSRDFFLLEAAKEDQVWQKGPPMLEYRSCPCVLAFGSNHLFVFGGCSTEPSPLSSSRAAWAHHLVSWAEVYDKTKEEWTHLPPLPSGIPPPIGGRDTIFASVLDGGEDSKLILVSWGDSFCKYDPTSHTWFCFHPSDLGLPTMITLDSVTIGSTVYSFVRSSGCLYAYDFEKRISFGGPLQCRNVKNLLKEWSLDRDLILLPFPKASDDDNGEHHLCFAWCRDVPRLPRRSPYLLSSKPSFIDYTYLFFVKVRVCKFTSPWISLSTGYLDAFVVHGGCCPINHPFRLRDAVLMVGDWDEVEGLEELSPYGVNRSN
ncbi:hypothetical protein Vadar_026140 [Vaccinium darrowii]|uniref:Uncharacterized protein n=1 Tax=Vaccinium darrowii TaxID=229202 RepID=A0ACB7Z6L0_9ERIC|nr:hypothetical protein Vadar_026140 [Vaccinium darrowii]